MTLEPIENNPAVDLNFTKEAGGYRSEKGVNNKIDSKLWRELVSSSGDSDTVHGELLRGASCIYTDMWQNGGGNLVSYDGNGYDCDHCDYYDQEFDNDDDDDAREDHEESCAESWVVNEHYQKMIDLLEVYLPAEGREVLKRIKGHILRMNYTARPSIDFDLLIDHAIHVILTTKNQPLVNE